MEPTAITYDICRSYILDYEQYIPDSNRLLGLVRSRSYEILAQVTSSYSIVKLNREEFRHLRQIEAFFKKNSSFTKEGTSRKALESFLIAEEQCSETNKRINCLDTSKLKFTSELDRMQRYIAYVLGDYDKFFNSIPELLKVTTGATSTRSRRNSQPFMKIGSRNISCSAAAVPYISALAKMYGVSKLSFKTTECNRVTFVPKSFKTDRTIACEPDWNIPFQLAFDTFVKKELRRKTQINLSCQTLNQELARLGSIGNHLATIDLSAASDSLSYNTAALLFPDQWFNYLDSFRSRQYSLEHEELGTFIGPYSKFSSMGNGCTFPMETLVFAAACEAVGSAQPIVYGDDIIIESDLVGKLTDLLSYLGFNVNIEKSFSSGPFRESCGADYWEGINITPFYIRKLDSRKGILSHNVNGLINLSYPGSRLAALCKSLVDDYHLRPVPFNENTLTGVFVEPSHAYAMKLINFNKRTQLSTFKGFIPKVKSYEVRDSRTYFLWFLTNRGRNMREVYNDYQFLTGGYKNSNDSRSICEVPFPRHKMVRKKVSWVLPRQGVPLGLYWSSEFLFPLTSE